MSMVELSTKWKTPDHEKHS